MTHTIWIVGWKTYVLRSVELHRLDSLLVESAPLTNLNIQIPFDRLATSTPQTHTLKERYLNTFSSLLSLFLFFHLSLSRRSLLSLREHRQLELDRGVLPDFLSSTAAVRSDPTWRGPNKIPEDLKDRRVEITGPVDRKMIINALNSGAKVYMADFEGTK